MIKIPSREERLEGIKEGTFDTKTTLFLLPALKLEYKVLKTLGFINAFSFVKGKSYKDCISVLFNPDEQTELGEFIDENKDRIIDEIDFGKGYTLVVFTYPVKYIRDKELFWKGKYSQFSSEYKSLFKAATTKFQMQVIKRDEALREFVEKTVGQELPEDSEVISIPEEIYETIDLKDKYFEND